MTVHCKWRPFASPEELTLEASLTSCICSEWRCHSEYDPELFAIAILHDLLEDVKGGMDILITFPDRVVQGVTTLTKQRSEPYMSYIERVAGNNDTLLVKMKDIEDNINLLRLDVIEARDLARVEKYHNEFN